MTVKTIKPQTGADDVTSPLALRRPFRTHAIEDLAGDGEVLLVVLALEHHHLVDRESVI